MSEIISKIDVYTELYKLGMYDKIPIERLPNGQFAYLTDKQLYALELLTDNKTAHVGYGGSARSGKTILEAFWQTMQLLCYEGTRYGLGRDELKRIRTKTINTYYKLWSFWGLMPIEDYGIDNKDYIIRFNNNSELILIETFNYPKDPDFLRFGGLELTGASVDESNESIKKAIETLYTRVGWCMNAEYNIPRKMLETFNPDKSHVYTRYYIPFKEKKETEKTKFVPALPGDNPHPSVKEWIEDVIAMGNQSLIERLVYGNFEYSDDPDLLISFEDLISLKDVDHKRGLNYCGADIARMGDDKTSFAKFDGNYLSKIRTFFELDTVKSAKELIKFIDIENVSSENCGIDTVGLGAGTYDYMNDKGKKCVEIISGASPTDSFKSYEFKNLRSQMWWQFRTDVKEMNIKIDSDDQELLTDLTAPHYKIVNEKVIQVESKDDIKKRLGRSPDKGDSVVYANAMRTGIIKKQKIARVW